MAGIHFSKYFGLNKSQYELDFVDIALNKGDTPLFIDPYALSLRKDLWSQDASSSVVNFFQEVINYIASGNEVKAKYMLSNLHEPNETKLGLSTRLDPRGSAIGDEIADDLYDALSMSKAAKSGLLADLEDCSLFIPGVDKDRVSDITTDIIRPQLIEYTQEQCAIYGIPIQKKPAGAIWDFTKNAWHSIYAELPVYGGKPIILVPKAIVRRSFALSASSYYHTFVLDFIQERELSARSSLTSVAGLVGIDRGE